MQKIITFSLIFLMFFSILPEIHAEEKTYLLEIDEHVFNIVYDGDADVLAMVIDPELTSLLIGVETSHDSKFVINFPKEMLQAESDEFAVLVNGLEVDYQLSQDSKSYTLVIFIPSGTEEVEIIGTYVIPEFSFGPIFGLILMSTIALILSKFKIFK